MKEKRLQKEKGSSNENNELSTPKQKKQKKSKPRKKLGRKRIKRLVTKNDTYTMLLEKIDKLSDDEKAKEIVKDSLDSYIDRINVIGSYENEKFYNIGFMDAINLIFECIGRC